MQFHMLKFIYSDKATKFCEISTNYFVAFSECMNFKLEHWKMKKMELEYVGNTYL